MNMAETTSLIFGVFLAILAGAYATKEPTFKTFACSNTTGANYPASCPRPGDPPHLQRCCEHLGEPSCCPQLESDINRYHTTCSTASSRAGVPQCPRSGDPDDFIVCCSESHYVLGVKVTSYGCCSIDDLAPWAIAVIVVAVVIFIALVTLCCCCCCSCCILAQRRQQRGYVIVQGRV